MQNAEFYRGYKVDKGNKGNRGSVFLYNPIIHITPIIPITLIQSIAQNWNLRHPSPKIVNGGGNYVRNKKNRPAAYLSVCEERFFYLVRNLPARTILQLVRVDCSRKIVLIIARCHRHTISSGSLEGEKVTSLGERKGNILIEDIG